MTEAAASAAKPPSLAADARVWLRVGCLSFGGPAGQIALMQRLLVEELRWISPSRFLAGLDLCMLLPGPEAQQLATYVGWTRQGWRGGVVAGGLFVLPGAFLMLMLSWLYVTWGTHSAVAALFAGLQCAVVAIVAQALLRIGRKALGSPAACAIAALAFAAIALFRAPFPLVVLGAAVGGLLLPPSREQPNAAADLEPLAPVHRSLTPAVVAAALWAIPLATLVLALGPGALLVRIALRFGELAMVSFGGAYALLAALAEHAVADGWLSAAQMADGLALAETTPGPLILVLQFVAFVAVQGAGGPHPLLSALAAIAIALWTLFLPSFVWIFLAAPYLSRIEQSPWLRRAIRGVTAAVVGVILHLSLWFALHVLLDVWSVAITAIAVALLFVGRQGIGRTLAVAALLGLLRLVIPE